jgi:predicted DNA-binding protein
MAERKISTALYLTPEQHEAMKLLSGHTKVPMAVYLRDAVDMVIQKHAPEIEAARAAAALPVTEGTP